MRGGGWGREWARAILQRDGLMEDVGLARREGVCLDVDTCRHMAISMNRWFHLHMDNFEPLVARPNC